MLYNPETKTAFIESSRVYYAKKDAAVRAVKYGVRTDNFESLKPEGCKPLQHYKWVASVAARKDTRYYLQQTFVTDTGAVATDGHRMHYTDGTFQSPVVCRIPSDWRSEKTMTAGPYGWNAGEVWSTNAGVEHSIETQFERVLGNPNECDFKPLPACPDYKLYKQIGKGGATFIRGDGTTQVVKGNKAEQWHECVCEFAPLWIAHESTTCIAIDYLLDAVGKDSGWQYGIAYDRWHLRHPDGRRAVIMATRT